MMISRIRTTSAVTPEQRAVDVPEHLDRVGAVAGRAGHLHRQPAALAAHAVADLVHPRLEALGVPGRADREREQGGVAVLGEHRLLRGQGDRGPVGLERALVLDHPAAVGGGQPARALVDDHRGRQLAARVALDGLERLDRLGLAGEEGDGLVLLRVLELAREQPADDRRDEEEDDRHRELRALAGRECEEPGHASPTVRNEGSVWIFQSSSAASSSGSVTGRWQAKRSHT